MNEKGFFEGLFDFSFKEFITLKVLKVLYVIALIAIGIFLIIEIVYFFNQSTSVGVLFLIFSPLFFILVALLVRVYLEVIAVIFRIEEEIRKLSKEKEEG